MGIHRPLTSHQETSRLLSHLFESNDRRCRRYHRRIAVQPRTALRQWRLLLSRPRPAQHPEHSISRCTPLAHFSLAQCFLWLPFFHPPHPPPLPPPYERLPLLLTI